MEKLEKLKTFGLNFQYKKVEKISPFYFLKDGFSSDVRHQAI